MCSLALPETVFGVDAENALRSAIADVVERSFFAMADEYTGPEFQQLAAAQSEWLAATVRFTEASCSGAVVCWIAAPLAERLFDSFSGRDPDEPLPAPEELADLAGEMANMICGAWLTRAANQQTFDLSKPTVVPCDGAEAVGEAAARGLTFAIDDFPIVVDVQVGPARTMPVPVLA